MLSYLNRWQNSKFVLPILLFVVSVLTLIPNINKPFWGEHDWNGVRYGNIARNYLRYNNLETKFAQIEDSGPIAADRDRTYFTHYPPILTLLIASVYQVFGVSEASTRVIPILATSLTIVFLFLIGRLVRNWQFGLAVSLIVLPTPLILYFGKTPVHESLVVMFSMASVYFYLKKRTFWFIVFLILSELTTWTGFFLVPALISWSVFKRDWIETRRLCWLVLLSIAVFLLYLGHNWIVTRNLFGGDLIGSFLQRSSIGETGKLDDLNLFNYLNRLRVWSFDLYSFLIVLLSAGWFVLKVFRRWQEIDYLVLMLFIYGILYLIIFPNSGFIHNYLVFYLLPYFAFSTVRFVESIMQTRWLLLLILIVSLVIFGERYSYLTALVNSSADKNAVLVGRMINLATQSADKILVLPKEFSNPSVNFLRFYSDRQLFFSDQPGVSYDWKMEVNLIDGSAKLTKHD